MKRIMWLFGLPFMIFIFSSATAAEGVLNSLPSALVHYAVSFVFPVGIVLVVYFQLIHKDEEPQEVEEQEAGPAHSYWVEKAPEEK